MRISALSTERAADVLCEITPHVTNILSDDGLLAELREAVDFTGAQTVAERLALIANKITRIIPILLKQKQDDVFGILGALNEKTVEQIAKQNFIVTAMQIREIVKDKELVDFFKSCADMEGGE